MTQTFDWKKNKHPLYRGDRSERVCTPNPAADRSVVRHILYLEGPGRETPYLSNTESTEIAQRFAGNGGCVWQAFAPQAESLGVRHIAKSELLALLKGVGKGHAKWDSPFEVMQARRYVEQWAEHLFDFSGVGDADAAVRGVYAKP